MILRKEKVSFYSHLSGAVLSIAGGMFLLSAAGPVRADRIIVLVYVLSVCWLFCASSIYHAQKKVENGTNIWRKFDHFAIFFMIAGTYTPLCYYYLSGSMRWWIIGTQWTLVALGIVFKIFFLNAPRRLYTIIYLLMGWMALIPIKDLFLNMPASAFAFLVGGGVIYTAGAVIYARKKPDPYPGFF
ncbi:MAG: PAQR family membrane homeostasis protein TrhA, partial [Spirochaetota bacterium]